MDAMTADRFVFELRRLLRTAQNFFPAAKGWKDRFYYYMRKWLRIPHERDFRVLRLIPDRPDDLYLDVGANHGQSIASIRLFKPRVPIVSFEPHPVLAAEIRRLYGTDRALDLRETGLGSEAGTLELFTPAYRGFVYDGLASFDRANAERWLSAETVYGFDPGLRTMTTRTCPVARLDDLGLSPTFIKIDVQGLEFEVLRGGAETLTRCRPILFMEDPDHDPRIAALLRPLGYREHWFDGRKLVEGVSPRETSIMLTDDHVRAVRR